MQGENNTLRRGARRRLTVSMIVGTLARHDAIANACRQRMEGLRRYCELHHLELWLKAYTYGADGERRSIQIVDSPSQIICDRHFQLSDLILFEFGIYTELFESIHFAPRESRVIVFHHGVTHPHVASRDTQPLLRRSYEQMRNLFVADEIVTTSHYLRGELNRMGVPEERISVQRLCAEMGGVQSLEPQRSKLRSDTLNLLYVGRFVLAKGVADLLAALAQARDEHATRFRLRLIGGLAFSDRGYLETLKQLVREHSLSDCVQFQFDVPRETLAKAYQESDALVIPSYHEGFCVPVIEAFQQGCPVIGTAATALPETMGGLGLTYPCGDAAALCDRLRRFAAALPNGVVECDRGRFDTATWLRHVRTHLETYSHERFLETLCQILDRHRVAPIAFETRKRIAQARLAQMRTFNTHAESPSHAYLAQALQPLYDRLGAGPVPKMTSRRESHAGLKDERVPQPAPPSRSRVIWIRFKETVKRVPGLGWAAVRTKRFLREHVPIEQASVASIKGAIKRIPVLGQAAVRVKRALASQGRRQRWNQPHTELPGLHRQPRVRWERTRATRGKPR